MNKYISRIIVMVVLLIKAAAIVIQDYSLPMLLSAVVILGLLAIAMFVGSNAGFANRFHWIAVAAVLVFWVLPNGPIELDSLLEGLSGWSESVFRAIPNSGIAIIALLLLIALQLFFRKKANVLFIILRYAAAWITMFGIFGTGYARGLIIVAVLWCLVRELIACKEGAVNPCMLKCILSVAFATLLMFIGGYDVARGIDMLFTLDRVDWLSRTLLVFAIAVLTLIEDYSVHGNAKALYQSRNAGWMLMFWCLLTVVMNVWDSFYNYQILVFVFPAVCVICDRLVCGFNFKKKVDWSEVFYGCWAAMFVFLLMLAKSMNNGLILSYVLVAILLAVMMFWNKLLKENKKLGLFESGTGIAAILIMYTMQFTEFDQIGDEVGMLFAVILGCVIWGMICRHQRDLQKKVSDVYPAEYQLAIGLRKLFPVIVLIIASLRVLFVL